MASLLEMRREWRGWADRYDGYGAVVGLACFLLLGTIFGIALDQGLDGWLLGFAVGCAATNVTSFILRRRPAARGTSRARQR
jgi:hypothetical protein